MGTSNPALLEAISSRKGLPTTKRQRRSLELKRQIVEETLTPGASVARVARAHGVNANQLFTWRRLYRQGRLGASNRTSPGLLAVRVTEAPCAPGPDSGARAGAPPRDAQTHRTPSGVIQIELPKGRLRLTGTVDRETLRVVLEALRG
jgi:transposase